jgi:hypothetical protein
LALPFLDAMVPAGTALAQTAAVPKLRTGFFYIPHGAIMGNTSHGPSLDKWTPSGSGATFKLSPILASLEPYKKYVTSFGNLQNAATAGSVHSFTPATWLSATRPDTGAPRAHMATTLDQVIAKIIGQETPLPSLEVAAETTVQSAAGGGGYYSTLSFRDAESPLPMEPNPRKVFLQLFGEGDTPQERATINTRTSSLLDLILEGHEQPEGQPRERGPSRARRISRERSRGRAPNAEGGGERSVRVHDSRGSGGGTGLLRRPGDVDVRPGCACVSGGPDAGGVLHHGRGRDEPDRTTTSVFRIPSIPSHTTPTI